MDTEPMSAPEIGRLARNAVDRIDTWGVRGVTLVTMREIEALAIVAALSGLLPPREGAESEIETPIFRTRRRSSNEQ